MGPNPIGPVFLLEEEEKPESSQALYTHHAKTQQKAAVHKPRREASPETESIGPLILTFQTPDYEKIQFLLFKPLIYDILLWQPEQTNAVICRLFKLFILFF